MKRYSLPEVDAALELVERGNYEVHNQIVLAGEVQALRRQYQVVRRCQLHCVTMHVPPGYEDLMCPICDQVGALRAQVHALQYQLRAATGCPLAEAPLAMEARSDGTVVPTCSYRLRKQADVEALQRSNNELRAALQERDREMARMLTQAAGLPRGGDDGTR